MRTTVTLDPEAEQVIRERMVRQRISFKQALNDAIRAGGRDRERHPFVTRTAPMGLPRRDLDKALSLAAALDDAETLTKLDRGA